jgi:hypothetical protein
MKVLLQDDTTGILMIAFVARIWHPSVLQSHSIKSASRSGSITPLRRLFPSNPSVVASQISQVGNGVPGRIQLIPIGREREFDHPFP